MGWGIVGTGAIAATFAVAAQAAGVPVVAVTSRKTQTAQDFAKRFGVAGAVGYNSISDMATHPDIHAIYIATPNASHVTDTLEAIAAGKHVLCEKPLASSAAEATTIIEAARAAGVFCMEGLWSLCLPAYQEAIASVQQGAIGTLKEVHGTFCVPHTPQAMPRLFDGPGSGALLDRGVYLIALSQAFLGPLTLRSCHGDRSSGGVDLAATMVLENAQSGRAVLTCGIDRMGGNAIALVGTTGRITFTEPVTNPNGYVVRTADPSQRFTGPKGQFGTVQKIKQAVTSHPRLRQIARALKTNVQGRAGGLEHQILHVEKCLHQGLTESPLVPLDGSHTVLRLIDEARAQLAASGT